MSACPVKLIKGPQNSSFSRSGIKTKNMLRQSTQRLTSSIKTFSITQSRTIKMAAFSDKSFDFKGYQANRPRYPDLLYDTVLQFHKGDRETVLDLGTGPGLSLFPFAYQFKHLVGCDPSEGMIGQAEQAWQAWKEDQQSKDKLKATDAKFIQSSAENLEGIADESIDLITAAQAAHWFDPNKVWQEVYRVLKPNGSVAFWGYGTNYLPRHPSLAGAMQKYMSSTDEDMGRYWPPGRELVENLLNDFPFPSNSSIMSKWDIDSALRIQHTLSSPGIADLAWTRGEAPEEKFRMEVSESIYNETLTNKKADLSFDILSSCDRSMISMVTLEHHQHSQDIIKHTQKPRIKSLT